MLADSPHVLDYSPQKPERFLPALLIAVSLTVGAIVGTIGSLALVGYLTSTGKEPVVRFARELTLLVAWIDFIVALIAGKRSVSRIPFRSRTAELAAIFAAGVFQSPLFLGCGCLELYFRDRTGWAGSSLEYIAAGGFLLYPVMALRCIRRPPSTSP